MHPAYGIQLITPNPTPTPPPSQTPPTSDQNPSSHAAYGVQLVTPVPQTTAHRVHLIIPPHTDTEITEGTAHKRQAIQDNPNVLERFDGFLSWVWNNASSKGRVISASPPSTPTVAQMRALRPVKSLMQFALSLVSVPAEYFNTLTRPDNREAFTELNRILGGSLNGSNGMTFPQALDTAMSMFSPNADVPEQTHIAAGIHVPAEEEYYRSLPGFMQTLHYIGQAIRNPQTRNQIFGSPKNAAAALVALVYGARADWARSHTPFLHGAETFAIYAAMPLPKVPRFIRTGIAEAGGATTAAANAFAGNLLDRVARQIGAEKHLAMLRIGARGAADWLQYESPLADFDTRMESKYGISAADSMNIWRQSGNRVSPTLLEQMAQAEHFGGLSSDQRFELVNAYEHIDVPDTLGRFRSNPQWETPINGVTMRQRVYNLRKVMQQSDARLRQPRYAYAGQHLLNGKYVKDVHGNIFYSPFFPRPNLLEFERPPVFPERPESGAVTSSTGHSGAVTPTSYLHRERTFDTFSNALWSENAKITENPHIDPGLAFAQRIALKQHYMNFVDQILEGQTWKGQPVREIEYEWLGKKDIPEYTSASGQVINLQEPIKFGSGPEGYRAAQAFYQEHRVAFQKLLGYPDEALDRVGAAFQDDLTHTFRQENPHLNIHAAEDTAIPDLRGYAVDPVYLNGALDTNPMMENLFSRVQDRASLRNPKTRPEEKERIRQEQQQLARIGGNPDTMSDDQLLHLHADGVLSDQFLTPKIGKRWLQTLNQTVLQMKLGMSLPWHANINSSFEAVRAVVHLAGGNPIKLTRYMTEIAGALGIANRKMVQEAEAALIKSPPVQKYLSLWPRASSPLPKVWDSTDDIPSEWIQAATDHGLIQRKYGMDPLSVYRLTSAPFGDLSRSERYTRAMLSANQFSQKIIFEEMEGRIAATLFHIYRDYEKYSEPEAATVVRREMTNYSRETRFEKQVNLGSWYYFYNFMNMSLKSGWGYLKKGNRFMLSSYAGAQTVNAQQQNPQAPDTAISLASQGTRMMSLSPAPYRYGLDIMRLGGFLFGFQQQSAEALQDLSTTNLTPLAALGYKAYKTIEDSAGNRGEIPQSYYPSSPLWDVQADEWTKIKQFTASLETLPMPMGFTPNMYSQAPSLQRAMMNGLQSGLRGQLSKMTPNDKKFALQYIYQLNAGNESMIGPAYKLLNSYEHSQRASGGLPSPFSRALGNPY